MSKKEESLLGKIKHMTGEQMDILNSDFINQKLESLNRRVEQLQCKDNHEEIAKALLKKVSKLERRIDVVIAFQEELFSKMFISSDGSHTGLHGKPEVSKYK
ncbi:activating transcription factor 7-interacting protein 2 [Patagioenas fasciata]